MKLLLLAAVVAVSAVLVDSVHVTLDDSFDFTTLSKDELKEVARCLCGGEMCNELTSTYTIHYPAVVQEACQRCNPSQKHITRVFWDLCKEQLPEEYDRCVKMHDPEGKYWEKFLQAVAGF